MPSASDTYEVYAVRYARHDRPARDNFLGGDPHDVNMPLDYFVWAVVGTQQTFIVDMGFTVAQAHKRKREYLRSPGEAQTPRHRAGKYQGRDRHPHALRPRGQSRPFSERHVPHPGSRDGLCDQPLHVPSPAQLLVRGRGCGRHGAARVRAPGRVPRRHRRARARRERAPHRRPHQRPAMRARRDAARPARPRLRRGASLRSYGGGQGVPDRLQCRRHARRP